MVTYQFLFFYQAVLIYFFFYQISSQIDLYH
jgi:hypothetical protein